MTVHRAGLILSELYALLPEAGHGSPQNLGCLELFAHTVHWLGTWKPWSISDEHLLKSVSPSCPNRTVGLEEESGDHAGPFPGPTGVRLECFVHDRSPSSRERAGRSGPWPPSKQ